MMASSIPVSPRTPGRAFFDGATHAEFDMQVHPSIDPDDLRLEPLADFWHRFVWRGTLPRREDFHPGDFRSLLGNLLLLDRMEDRRQTRFRLVGTTLTGILRRDATGRRVVDTYEPALAERMLHNLDFVATTRSPIRVCTTLTTEAGGLCRGEALLIPLFEGDGPRAPVRMVLGGATWLRVSRSDQVFPSSALRPWDRSLLAERPSLH
jgi:hypothetical protein